MLPVGTFEIYPHCEAGNEPCGPTAAQELTVTLPVPEQPFALVTFTEYVPATVTFIDAVVDKLDHKYEV